MKKYSILLLVLFSFFFAIPNIKAYSINTNDLYILRPTDAVSDASKEERSASTSCPIFGDPTNKDDFAYYLQSAFNIMKFAGILIAIGLTLKDLITAVASQSDDSIKKVGQHAMKRLMYAIIIFFLPDLLNFFFGVVGLYGVCVS